jgi:hypothetical protein
MSIVMVGLGAMLLRTVWLYSWKLTAQDWERESKKAIERSKQHVVETSVELPEVIADVMLDMDLSTAATSDCQQDDEREEASMLKQS